MPHTALPLVKIFVDKETEDNSWYPAKDLLTVNEFDRKFVVETENDGNTFIRFPYFNLNTLNSVNTEISNNANYILSERNEERKK